MTDHLQGGINSKDKSGLLGRLIDSFAAGSSDRSSAADHLWKLAKKHDRRVYHLIRFTMSPESDYKKVVNAIVRSKR